ncbi:MAG: hypothetical protein IJI36_13995 [Kiritimatiellae bacterium]|nr:hypothetical protein [Kiritimatiellia bacterium]
MNAKNVLGLSLIGLLALSFVPYESCANDNGTVLKTKSENRCMKGKTPSSRRIVVAIRNFENKSNAPDEIAREVRTRIQQCIAGTMKFEVEDRERLKEILREQALLAASGVTNGEAADVPVADKIKPAAYIVYGKVLSYGEDKHVADFDGGAFAFVKSKIELEVMIVNCNIGNIMAMKTVVGHGTDKVMVSGGAKTSTGQGSRNAIDEAGHAVADWLREVLAYPAKVLRVDKAEITIDMNEDEVKEGDLFDVIAEGGVMVDPDSGVALEIDGKCIGRVVITRPGLQTSKAEPVDGGRLSLEKLDVSKHTYKLHRVTKTVLMKEARRRARQMSHEY